MTLILPEAFRSRIAAQMGSEQQLFFQALEAPAPVSLRLNPQKVSPPHFDQAEMCQRKIFAGEAGLHPRSLFSCRLLLSTGSQQYGVGLDFEAVGRPAAR